MTDPTTRPDDPILDGLRELPVLAEGSRRAADRRAAEARVAYERAFRDDHESPLLGGALRRAAVPAVLAGVAFVYLSWAISAAAALAH